MSSRNRVEFSEEREYYREPRRAAPVREYDDVTDIRITEDRVPSFMREERRPEPGPLVLRSREIETVERPRRRSPSPVVRVRESRIERARSISPPPRRVVEEDIRFRQVERVREPSRAPSERVRIVERARSPSPPSQTMERIRIVDRGRSPSPSRERIRIIDRQKERVRSPSPPPKVVKGPVIEREVITHYRDIDHGIVAAPRPAPPPPTRTRDRETDIDIYTSRNETEVDIHKHSSHSHTRRQSQSRERPSRPAYAYDDEVLVYSDRDRADRRHLHVDIDQHRSTSRGRRAQSAAPPSNREFDEEAYEITSKIDARGRMGEARGGITKDWTIVDVPPGTERVRMDGAGGASAEVTWQKYSGVRRAKFIPDRDEKGTMVSTSTTVSDREVVRDHDHDRRLSVQITTKDKERDVDVTDRRVTIRPPAPPSPSPRRSEMWTEITKDLVIREAIDEMGYEYEETEYFFYVIQYLRYEDVLRLVQLSDAIRKARKDRAYEIQWEREVRDGYRDEYRETDYHIHAHKHRHSESQSRYDDDRVVEREVVYENRPSRGYR
ncbi:hypothetical protein B0T26DRAFT_681228 [Lasiosphaeria miniovina]|uniref:DUF8035 domain-containing protein n=1 Tax=Lasiosphaeria miniovina TaxID=1954250 RepID=A0AA39ZU61_9PEZI|nr:uncharacterized protein B0T26DRAFT_681228 [Lasiosphaeria miniovina]KAK0703570.1 hypothetical protein B0T26DRAFT_681228 [Lasiosphaeria miniovina]